MDFQKNKCVVVIDEELPIGLIANTAAILGTTLGKKNPDIVGEDFNDQDGNVHLGIVATPIPILKGTKELIKSIRSRLYEEEFMELLVVDFTNVAQSCNSYPDFVSRMSVTPEKELCYMGIAVCGDKKKVNKLMGSMPLLR